MHHALAARGQAHSKVLLISVSSNWADHPAAHKSADHIGYFLRVGAARALTVTNALNA
ncbi:hypothetical protein BN2476_1380021 [Paraburkholderia piptadeniae]|uniref:Uncharacterized protein n=1 Tax=Paraburkholderia piptadeniae TaxID=1701573 RepID=A0A1N7SWM5_9BURK|nr:hypothetical protein BN2476_1380021 [Paraburkholderia piptadeniae]